MRTADTYRGARRNAWATTKGFDRWRRDSGHANAANFRAKLSERAEQCARARAAVAAVFGTGISDAGSLFTFWSGERPRTRVIRRILRGLPKPAAFAAA